MRQAITTKFFGPTNSRGSRIKASCEAGSVTVHWDFSVGVEDNHRLAAFDLAAKLGWNGVWVGGAIATGYAFVLDTGEDGFAVPKLEQVA